jgi:hypothetical protein
MSGDQSDEIVATLLPVQSAAKRRVWSGQIVKSYGCKQPIADPPTDAVIWVPQYTGQTTRPY